MKAYMAKTWEKGSELPCSLRAPPSPHGRIFISWSPTHIFRCLLLINPHNKRHPFCSYHLGNSKGFRISLQEMAQKYVVLIIYFIIIINHNITSLHIPVFLFVSPVHGKSRSIQAVPNTYGLKFCKPCNRPP